MFIKLFATLLVAGISFGASHADISSVRASDVEDLLIERLDQYFYNAYDDSRDAQFEEQYEEIVSRIQEEFVYVNSYDGPFVDVIAFIRDDISDFKKLIAELKANNTGDESTETAYSLRSTEIARVEGEILRYQKEVIQYLEKVSIIQSRDIQENGDLSLKIESEYFSLDVSMPKVQVVTLIDELKQEITFEMDFTYTTRPYFSDEEIVVEGTVDLLAKIIKGDMYLMLNDLTLTSSNTDEYTQSSLDTSMEMFDAMKGKYVHIPLSFDTGMYQTLSTDVLAAAETLKNKSLLTPYKRVGGVYLLQLNQSTFKALAENFGLAWDQEGFNFSQQDFKELDISLTQHSTNASTISLPVDESDAQGSIDLKRTAGDQYKLTGKVVGSGYAAGNVFEILIQKGIASSRLYLAELNGEGYDFEWKNNRVYLEVRTDEDTFVASGALSTTQADIDMTFNEKSVGHIKGLFLSTQENIDILLDMREDFGFLFELMSTSRITFPKIYQIDAPSDFVEMEDIESQLGY